MIRTIKGVLSKSELVDLRATLAELDFIDGKKTAFGLARTAKNNSQLDKDEHKSLIDQLTAKLHSNKMLSTATMASRIYPAVVSRYKEGMSYGKHTDSAQMGNLRTDFSVTLFLSDPDSYEGGELIIDSDVGEVTVKLPAGDLVIYNSDRVHRVEPVTSGERLAIVTWIQSRVADPARRDILDDIHRSIAQVKKMDETEDNAALALRLLKAANNLERLWLA